jgi:hypothetical protein
VDVHTDAVGPSDRRSVSDINSQAIRVNQVNLAVGAWIRGRQGKGRPVSSPQSGRHLVYLHTQLLINEILPDEPDPAAANALQEGLGGQFGEMRTMMQYLFQSINFRGDVNSKPYKDLLQGVGTEEISHVELIGTTIARLLDGSPAYQGKKTDPIDEPAANGATPLKIALDTSNIHHYLVGAQGDLPVDAAGTRGAARTSTTAAIWCSTCSTT